MVNEYLAMYFSLPSGNNEDLIVPVRHFAADRVRLGRAVMGNQMFTDFEAAMTEMDVFRVRSATSIAFLLDSSLPGRKNIIKGKAKQNLQRIHKILLDEIAIAQGKPVIGGPKMGEIGLAFGTKTVKDPYPTGFLSNEFYDRKIFSKEGYYFYSSGRADFQIFPTFINNNFFFAIEFYNLQLPFISDYYRTYA